MNNKEVLKVLRQELKNARRRYIREVKKEEWDYDRMDPLYDLVDLLEEVIQYFEGKD